MTAYTCTVLMDPVGKGRPRFRALAPTTPWGQPSVRTYTPDKTRQAEAIVRATWAAQHGTTPLFAPDAPLAMSLTCYIRRPKAHAADVWHVVKPDLSNLLKVAEDALNRIAYADDAQLVHVVMEKRYTDEENPQPCVEIMLRSLKP